MLSHRRRAVAIYHRQQRAVAPRSALGGPLIGPSASPAPLLVDWVRQRDKAQQKRPDRRARSTFDPEQNLKKGRRRAGGGSLHDRKPPSMIRFKDGPP
jgi:hypothetical protein